MCIICKTNKKKSNMRSMTRQELADRAGVDRRTLFNYFELHKEELWSLGVRPNHIVPPCAVEWLSVNYGIRIDD
jgi:hypothetical protein